MKTEKRHGRINLPCRLPKHRPWAACFIAGAASVAFFMLFFECFEKLKDIVLRIEIIL